MYYYQGTSGFSNYIALAKKYFVTNGYDGVNFGPWDTLLRSHIAAMIVRAYLYQPGDYESQYGSCKHGHPRDTNNPCGFDDYSPYPYYSDVPATDTTFFPYIQKLRELGIGPTTSSFCPLCGVSRGDMAEMLIKAMVSRGSITLSYPPTPFFTDVPSWHNQFPYIQELREQGITAGVTATTYEPSNPLVRLQMAVFVIRALFTTP